jgi:hypothetical protein
VYSSVGINKAGGNVILNAPSEINGTCTFTQGLVNSTSANLLIFNDNALTSGANNSSFVNGPVRKVGNDSFIFPAGKNSTYAPAEISAPLAVSDHFTAEYFATDPNPFYNVTLKDATINNVSRCEYWIIDRTNGNSDVSVRLSWDSPRSCEVTSPTDIIVARWDGTMWKDHGNGGNTGTSTSGTVISAAPVTSFSPFTLASITALNPLPIELLNFTAKYNKDVVDLFWTTASETNNDYFTIQRSLDGVEFQNIGNVDGAGNSTSFLSYSSVDETPLKGTSYYRLKQTDFDGSTSFSGIVPVSIAEGIFEEIIYPNPTAGQLNIFVHGEKDQLFSFELIDIRGVKVLSAKDIFYTNGEFTLSLETLAAGTYILKTISGDKAMQKLVIKQ